MNALGLSPSSSRRWILLAVLMAALLGCKSAREDTSAKPQEVASRDVPACLEQGQEDSVDTLLSQLRRVGPAEEKFAAESLRSGTEAAAKRNWGAAAKGYGAAALCKPTVEAMLGYAHATTMLDTPRPDEREALDTKLRQFRSAIARYRSAIGLGERINQPLSAEQRREVEAKIACLKQFVANPDPSQPPCQLVVDSLRESKVIAVSGTHP